MCENPYLACLVTLQPIQRYSLDASIIFSDILVIPRALGLEVVMEDKKGTLKKAGPVFTSPLKTPQDMERLRDPLPNELDYVYNALYFTRQQLDGRVPLLGFCGSAWTLFTYMTEGQSTKVPFKLQMFSEVKKWIFAHPTESHQVLARINKALMLYMESQIEAGAQALQVRPST